MEQETDNPLLEFNNFLAKRLATDSVVTRIEFEPSGPVLFGTKCPTSLVELKSFTNCISRDFEYIINFEAEVLVWEIQRSTCRYEEKVTYLIYA